MIRSTLIMLSIFTTLNSCYSNQEEIKKETKAEMKQELVNQIIQDLDFLIQEAKKRKVEQGIFTFTKYINKIKNEKDQNIVKQELLNLNHEMSGMSRFAYFPENEWEVFDRIQSNIYNNFEK